MTTAAAGGGVLLVLIGGGGWLLKHRIERRGAAGQMTDQRLEALRVDILEAAGRLREAVETRFAWQGYDVCTLVAYELWPRRDWMTSPVDGLARSVEESLMGPVQPLAATLSKRVHDHRHELLLTEGGPRIIEAAGNILHAVDFVAPDLAASIRAWVGVAQRVGAFLDWTADGPSWQEPERVRTRGMARRPRSRPTADDLARRMMTARNQVVDVPIDGDAVGHIHHGLASLVSKAETMVVLSATIRR